MQSENFIIGDLGYIELTNSTTSIRMALRISKSWFPSILHLCISISLGISAEYVYFDLVNQWPKRCCARVSTIDSDCIG